MLLSGFSIVRNANIMKYPIKESILSALPIVDEFLVGVGQSDDDTRGIIESINSPKIKIFDTYWDTNHTQGGLILSEKTNEILNKCSGRWCLYLQADEVLHENDLQKIRQAILSSNQDNNIQGLLFNYLHFYGTFGVIACSRKWYRTEIRVIRNNIGIKSHGDAKGFRRFSKKLNVIDSGASVYHYGWVKSPREMGIKRKYFLRWWYGNKFDQKFNNFNFKKLYGLKEFKGMHPQCMRHLVKSQDWNFNYKMGISDLKWKDFRLMASDALEKITGKCPFEKKPYKKLINR